MVTRELTGGPTPDQISGGEARVQDGTWTKPKGLAVARPGCRVEALVKNAQPAIRQFAERADALRLKAIELTIEMRLHTRSKQWFSALAPRISCCLSSEAGKFRRRPALHRVKEVEPGVQELLEKPLVGFRRTHAIRGTQNPMQLFA